MNKKKRWWSRKKKESRYYSPLESNHRGGEVDDRTFGNVWTRIWRNRDTKGRVYYSFTQHRLYEKYGEVKLSRSFLSDDPEDVGRGAMWAYREIQRREMQELSVWDQDQKKRRTVKHAKQVEILRKKHARRR
jgi:hypothetical protein